MRHLEILRKLYRGRKRTSIISPVDLKEAFATRALHDLKTRGIHIVPHFMDTAKVEKIRAAVDQLLQNVTEEQWKDVLEGVKKKENRFGVSIGEKWNLWMDSARSDQRISHSEFAHPAIADFANDQQFMDIGNAYLEKQIALKFCMTNRTQYQPSNLGSGGGWHRDNNYKRGFKALLYLSDSDEKNGCFQYLERSASIFHHLLKTPFPDKYQFTHEEVLEMVDRDEHKITNAVGRAGTLVMFDTNGVHRGRPLEEGGARYAMTNYYID
jgi:Phytanoyl-CoA dioxygenase (PhyH)